MSKQIEFQRFNVYSGEDFLLDFVVPTHRLDDLLDQAWEIEAESAVGSYLERLGYFDCVALFDRRFVAAIDGDLRRGATETYLFLRESDFT